MIVPKESYEKIAAISLDRTTYPLVVGNTSKTTFDDWETSGSTVQLQATVNHDTYTEADISWTSSNAQIAPVNNGLVQGRTTGFAVITAALPSGDKAVCYISVIDNITRSTVMTLELNTTELVLNKDSSASLIPIIYPEDVLGNGAMNRNVVWNSSNTTVVMVDDVGKVTAVGVGESVITAQSQDVGRVAQCQVSVVDQQLAVTGINKGNYTGSEQIDIVAGKQVQLIAKTRGADAEVSWKSLNSYIADVDENGLVTAYSNGKVDILVTSKLGGWMEQFTFNVSEPAVAVQSVNIKHEQINLVAGSSKSITATVSPAIILDKQIKWSSTDEDVVKVTETDDTIYGAAQAVLTGVSPGTAIVIASRDGKFASCQVTVAKAQVPVSKISLKEQLEIDIDQVHKLAVTVNSDATEKELAWFSTNRNVATINQDGIVKGYQAGPIKVYAIAKDSLDASSALVVTHLQQKRSIDGCKDALSQLANLLSNTSVIWSACSLTVKESSPYLRNVHAPLEAITATSVNLLWNRASLLDTGDFAYYQVECDEKLIAKTKKLGYTIKDLSSSTDYTFTIKAMDSNDQELISESINVTTKQAPTQVINVMDQPYGAVGNGRVMDTVAIQKAINDCPVGGTVVLPEGYVFYSGALFLKSNMTFQVDGILIGSTDPKDYPRMITRWEGWRKLYQPADQWANSTGNWDNSYAHASLINAGVYDEGDPGKIGPYNVSNLVICGKGQINGNGFKLAYNEGPNGKTGNGGKPVPESTKLDATVRGRTITLHNAENVYVADLNIAYSPSWTVHPIYCDRLTFDNIDLISKGTGKTGAADDITILNGDGIDPDSSTNINIFDCFFCAGDDAIAMKSGRNREGNELDKPLAYIRITDCVSKDSKGGFCIGSEQAAGAHDILWQNLTVENINLFGLWIKANEARGGVMEDILWKDCWNNKTSAVIYMQLDYSSSQTNRATSAPKMRYMTFENIHGVGRNLAGIRFNALENSYTHDITIRGCSFDEIARPDPRAFWINYGYNFDIRDVKMPEGYSWTIENAAGVKIKE